MNKSAIATTKEGRVKKSQAARRQEEAFDPTYGADLH